RLENAEEILRAAFARVEIRNYDDHLWVTEAAPLVNYVLSGWRDQVREGMVESFITFVEERIKRDGGVRITKESGLVIARK
ncbi:MAG: MerR family transcriptional regulator, partial [Chloroflexi bacterium]|nr:MerR family transcriptional regulator [Chloroflexota bacterium]